MRSFRSIALLLPLACLTLRAAPASAEANAAFDRYVKLAEEEMNQHQGQGDFLWVDRHPDKRTQVWLGQPIIQPMETLDHGQEIEAPGAEIQHWFAAVYLDDVAIDKVRDIALNFAVYKDAFKDELIDSKLIKRDGNRFDFQMRLFRKKFGKVLINVDATAQYTLLDPARIRLDCRSTHVGEVLHPKDKKSWDKERPADDEEGYLSRLNLYWRLEQADNGVYVEVELISLGREAGGALNPTHVLRASFETYPKALTQEIIEALLVIFPHRR